MRRKSQNDAQNNAIEGGHKHPKFGRKQKVECLSGDPEKGDRFFEDKIPLNAPIDAGHDFADIDGREEAA